MTGRKGRISPRSRIYFGCEGSSEVGFGRIIQDLADIAKLHIHIDTDDFGTRAGASRARVEFAIQQIKRKESSRGSFVHKAILMDFDQIERNEQEFDLVNQLARKADIQIIWQRPCHEALLPRHLPGCVDRRPQTTELSLTQLKTQWPEYRKPMTRFQLSRRIGIRELRQAANVEPELTAFLKAIGII